MKKHLFHFILLLSFTEAKIGIFQQKNKQRNNVPLQTLQVPSPLPPPTDMKTTNAADIARDFEKALVAVNQQREEIHVGHLLTACARLENTMRTIGFSQGANDISNNMIKIRSIYNLVDEERRDSMPELLKYELVMGINTCDGRKKLKESSATMGLLWLGRNLNYQYDMFRHILDQNVEPYEAACYAYENNMKMHMPWAIQKVCQTAMKKLKTLRREEMLAGIGGFSPQCYGNCEDQATRNDLRKVIRCLEPMMCRWRQVFSDLGLDEV